MYTDKKDLATLLLAQLSATEPPRQPDITTATCATVDNMLPIERSFWSEKFVLDQFESRGFDTSLIRNVRFLNDFGKMKIKFIDHSSVLTFKLLFDQSSFDGITRCNVSIVDCCCGKRGLSVDIPPPDLSELLSDNPAAPLVEAMPVVGTQICERVFVGGLAPETTDEKLRAHFGKYGPLTEAAVILDRRSKLSRGFGFIGFDGGLIPPKILTDYHVIDGKSVGLRMYGNPGGGEVKSGG